MSYLTRLMKDEAAQLRKGLSIMPLSRSATQQAIPLPCNSIQLFPRGDGRSLVYVDGKQLSGRAVARVNLWKARTSNSRIVKTLISPESSVPEIGSMPDPNVSASAEGGGTTGSDIRFSAGVVDESRMNVDASGGAEAVTGPGWPVKGQGHPGDSMRLVGEMEISKPAYLQVHGIGCHIIKRRVTPSPIPPLPFRPHFSRLLLQCTPSSTTCTLVLSPPFRSNGCMVLTCLDQLFPYRLH